MVEGTTQSVQPRVWKGVRARAVTIVESADGDDASGHVKGSRSSTP